MDLLFNANKFHVNRLDISICQLNPSESPDRAAMPKVLSYTPTWLARPSHGFELFDAKGNLSARSNSSIPGPNKRLAHRGTEVLFAIGTQLRWGDLALLQHAGEGSTQASVRGWRLLRTPVAREITQLSVSPDGSLIAVMTGHTCHICVLPASSHLRAGDPTPLRLRSFQLGPTAHVLEQAPLACALWHPLSPPDAQCLITVTKDACVRLWELDTNNRHSFDEPALAVDLKKLANATTTNADMSASKYGVNRGFSPDEVEMEVAAACFGGQGGEDEDGWASMTLWVAMNEGDVYALCPFLPSRFRTASTALPSLSTNVVGKSRVVNADPQATEIERRNCDTQSRWLGDLDRQDPFVIPGESGSDQLEIYARPDRPGAIPKLQGPFQIMPEPCDGAITDISVTAPAVDEADLLDGDGDLDELPENDGLSVSIVCLATNTGFIHICLDIGGVEAEWLPQKRSKVSALDEIEEPRELLLFQTIDFSSDNDLYTSWPTFTSSPLDRYELLVTFSRKTFGLSFRPWIWALENELANASASGTELRLKILMDSAATEVDALMSVPSMTTAGEPTTTIALLDPLLGQFLLAVAASGPYAAVLDFSTEAAHPYEPALLALPAPELRQPYMAAQEFFTASSLDQKFGPKRANAVTQAELTQPLQSRPETLQLLTDAHRVLSHETHRLGLAAAELFRRCERMRAELQGQIRRVGEILDKVATTTGANELDEAAPAGDDALALHGKLVGKVKTEQRMLTVQSDTKHLHERLEALRRKMLKLGGEKMSAKERLFAEEVENLRLSVMPAMPGSPPAAPVNPTALLKLPDHDHEVVDESAIHARSDVRDAPNMLVQRLEKVFDMKDNLTALADNALDSLTRDKVGPDPRRSTHVGAEYRKQKMGHVMALLERETALIDAVVERLGRLGALD